MAPHVLMCVCAEGEALFIYNKYWDFYSWGAMVDSCSTGFAMGVSLGK